MVDRTYIDCQYECMATSNDHSAISWFIHHSHIYSEKKTSLFSSQRRALTLEPFFIIATGKAKRERFTHNVRCTLCMKLMWFVSYPSNVINRCPVLFYVVFCYLFIIHVIVVGCCVVNEYSMTCFDISPENRTLC